LIPEDIHAATGHTGWFSAVKSIFADPSTWLGLTLGLLTATDDATAGACADLSCRYSGSVDNAGQSGPSIYLDAYTGIRSPRQNQL
jgi:hypothetical protein